MRSGTGKYHFFTLKTRQNNKIFLKNNPRHAKVARDHDTSPRIHSEYSGGRGAGGGAFYAFFEIFENAFLSFFSQIAFYAFLKIFQNV